MTPAAHDDAQHERERMVRFQLARRDITDQRVLAACERVPRHEFVPRGQRGDAYADHPLLIGHGATISQPYIVALMAQELHLSPSDHVLEIGTGSGYGAAILAELAAHVVTIERVPELAESARANLAGYGERVEVVEADGTLGYPDGEPYDGICVTAAAPRLPGPLLDQLAIGGRMIIPVDAGGFEDLVRVTRTERGFDEAVVTQVRFVPLVGRHGFT